MAATSKQVNYELAIVHILTQQFLSFLHTYLVC